MRTARCRILTLVVTILCACSPMNADSAAQEPVQKTVPTIRSAYLGGGCFWCLEAYFETLPGVVEVVSGYAGGSSLHPSYREVCTGETGHAEVVRIDYDPERIGYETLLEKFWLVHDPTSVDRQGPDEGPQYRSIILWTDDAQRVAAEHAREALQRRIGTRVATEIVPLTEFYKAEDYHQDYYRRNRGQGYCRAVIAPKLRKLGVR